MRLAHISNFLDISNPLFLLRCPSFLWVLNITFSTLFRPRASSRFTTEGHARYCGAGMRVARGKIAISGISSSVNHSGMFIAVGYTIYKRGPRAVGRGLKTQKNLLL